MTKPSKKAELRGILDFVDSYCLALTNGKYGLDSANRAQLKADISQLLEQEYKHGYFEGLHDLKGHLSTLKGGKK